MTNMLIGANPDDLYSAAERLKRAAEKVTAIGTDTARLVRTSSWKGTDADRFDAAWGQKGRASLQNAAELLRGAAETLRRNAEDQRRTSEAGGGSVAGSRHGSRGPSDLSDRSDRSDAAPAEIPPPPGNPGHDPGAGDHGSQPVWRRGDDVIFHGVAATAATAADALGYNNASRHLRHYLNNSGDALDVDPDRIARDAPGFRAHTETQAHDAANDVAAEAIADGRYGEPIPFTTDWSGYYVGPDESKDWFYAMGGLSTSATGYVVVHEGDPPTIEVSYQTHVYDRYNWDEGKAVTIGPVTVTDEKMGSLHTAGLAREYDVTGSSGTHTYTQTGVDGPVSDSSSPDAGRDGERTDPTRDQQPGRSRTTAGGSPR